MISDLLLPPTPARTCREKKRHLELGYNFDPNTYMDSSQQQKQEDIMEVPEIHGDLLLIELLDASLADENGGHQQLGFEADVDGDCWIDSQESHDIHGHQDCEDCDLDGMLPDFDEYGGSSRLRSPAPYVVFDHGGTLEWAETADAAAMDPFTSGCTGDWYMDGLVMAMEWEEQDAGSGFPFELCYGDAGEAAAEAEQVYASSPLWE